MGVLASIIPMVGRPRGDVLPSYTLRFKANRAVSLSDFRALPIMLTLVDEESHTYDVKLEQSDWSGLFNPTSGNNTWLIEVVQANTSRVDDMSDMFRNCVSLTLVSLFDMEGVLNASGMFYGCSSLSLVPQFEIVSAEDISHMFQGCTSLTSMPLFDTYSARDMSYMFADCELLASIPLFDVFYAEDMSSMFQGCRKVQGGALALYEQASTKEIPLTSHSNTFTDCGVGTPTGLSELQQIPTSWGGLAT